MSTDIVEDHAAAPVTPNSDGARRRSATELGAPKLPSVNLLPNSVLAARALKGTKRVLALVLVLVLVLLAAVSAWSYLDVQSAEEDKETEQNRTVTLMAEQAKYAEVPRVLDQLSKTSLALLTVSSIDVLWPSYLSAIAATTPDDITIQSMAVDALSPTSAAASAQDSLTPAISTGRITLGATSQEQPEIADWIDSLNEVPGFADARIVTSIGTGKEGEVVYTSTVTVDLTADAYSSPFIEEDAE